MADAGLKGGAKASDPGKEGALRLKTGKIAFRLGFRKEEVPRMTFSAKLGEINMGNTVGIVSARRGIRAGASVAA